MSTTEDSERDIIEFEVDGNGTLRLAGFPEPTTRAEFYEGIAHCWAGSPAQLASAMSECLPLAWEIQSHYELHREAVDSAQAEAADELERARAELEEADMDAERKRLEATVATLHARVQALTEELRALPKEPEQGAEDWLLGLTDEAFRDDVVPAVEAWFSDLPNWGCEEECIPKHATGQGFAFEYFRDMMDPDDCKILGVQVVEGDRPGSSYCAAELTINMDEANELAEEYGIGVRFSPCG